MMFPGSRTPGSAYLGDAGDKIRQLLAGVADPPPLEDELGAYRAGTERYRAETERAIGKSQHANQATRDAFDGAGAMRRAGTEQFSAETARIGQAQGDRYRVAGLDPQSFAQWQTVGDREAELQSRLSAERNSLREQLRYLKSQRNSYVKSIRPGFRRTPAEVERTEAINRQIAGVEDALSAKGESWG
jgi:hypothetical protein